MDNTTTTTHMHMEMDLGMERVCVSEREAICGAGVIGLSWNMADGMEDVCVAFMA